jgi:hypothetical protein
MTGEQCDLVYETPVAFTFRINSSLISFLNSMNMFHTDGDMLTGDSTTAVAREQLCEHVVSPATREHGIIEETPSVWSVPATV